MTHDSSFSVSFAKHGTVVRWAIAVLVTIAGVWATNSFTTSIVFAERSPDRALAAWSTAAALSRKAEALERDPTPTKIRRAILLSRHALAKSPIDARAARTLGIGYAAQNESARARDMMRYAETLSRRDDTTQLWLIEERVAANDVGGALIHYHRAMQTSQATRGVLSPILAQASDDPVIIYRLAPILRTRPEWWSVYLGDFVERTRSPTSLAIVADSLRLDPAVNGDRERLSTILQRYVDIGEVGAGRKFYDHLVGQSRAPVATIVQGGFEKDFNLPPFGWQMSETGSTAGTREARDGADGQFALTLDGNEGQEAARQLLNLAPGRYVMTAKIGEVRPGLTSPPSIIIRCLGADDRLIADTYFPIAQPIGKMTLSFTVPLACSGQWLTVRTASAIGYLDVKPWIDAVAIRRVGGAGGGQ